MTKDPLHTATRNMTPSNVIGANSCPPNGHHRLQDKVTMDVSCIWSQHLPHSGVQMDLGIFAINNSRRIYLPTYFAELCALIFLSCQQPHPNLDFERVQPPLLIGWARIGKWNPVMAWTWNECALLQNPTCVGTTWVTLPILDNSLQNVLSQFDDTLLHPQSLTRYKKDVDIHPASNYLYGDGFMHNGEHARLKIYRHKILISELICLH